MKAIILAAGKGTRFLPITNETPKPLIEINNKPILEYIFEQLPDSIDQIILITAHLEEKIEQYFGDSYNNKKIIYSSMKSSEKHGTAIALDFAKSFLSENEVFLVMNGDDLILKEDIQKILDQKSDFVFAIHKSTPEDTRFLNIKIENNKVIEFEKITEIRPINIATGVYKLNTNIFNYDYHLLKGGEYSLPHTILKLSKDISVESYEMKKWLPINNLEELELAKDKIEYFYK